ncbi:DUF4239 domain-containing protein [Runella sp.]|jgi:hypothetical protein|uniref:bestrophin-like domain n=1 Tax=Runella sp. TaxID=1960881 RepID=UPI002622FF46|nr:DUF4239 domain-containing protein [Runella sp.]
MGITYYMLQIDPFLLFILILSFGGIFAGLGTFLFRRYIKVKVLKSHNEVTGFLFTAITSFYALLLGFVVFVVWGQLNDLQGNVSQEGSSAFGLYRDIKFYPDTTESKQLMKVYLDFVFDVIDDEFPNMARMQASQKTLESFNQVFYKMERINPKNQFQLQLVTEMFHHLNELATYRGLRTATVEMEIPSPIWWPMMLGAIITIVCAMLLDIENSHIHIGLNALFGIFIGMFFFIIIELDHPFTGSLSIQPDSYMQIFNMEEWANKPSVKNK